MVGTIFLKNLTTLKIYNYRKLVKKLLPGFIIRKISGIFYGWHGNFRTWNDAAKRCTGYDSDAIIEKVKAASAAVRDGLKPYERDSVLYDEIHYAYPLMASLMMIAAENKGVLNILDFGGALGSTFQQNKIFLDRLNKVNWGIVEQNCFTEIGRREFSTESLRFFSSIEECYSAFRPDIILLSSVIHYFEEPYKLLDQIIAAKPEYILIDRTPFISGKDRITIQKVPPSIYRATYPCWFLNREKFLAYMLDSYNLLLEFDALDRANIPSEFKGFLFAMKK